MVGEKFGRLIVLSRARSVRRPRWRCRCDCGKIKIVRQGHLRSGHTLSCGCLYDERVLAKTDFTGRRFGNVIVLKDDLGNTVRIRCDCGNETDVTRIGLSSRKSCGGGCLLGKHLLIHGDCGNDEQTVEYRCWLNMKARCYNPNHVSYHNYGGRGITVCKRWRFSYENFIADVGRKSDPLYSIDRINTNGDYTPSNVRWTDRQTQALNRRKKVA